MKKIFLSALALCVLFNITITINACEPPNDDKDDLANFTDTEPSASGFFYKEEEVDEMWEKVSNTVIERKRLEDNERLKEISAIKKLSESQTLDMETYQKGLNLIKEHNLYKEQRDENRFRAQLMKNAKFIFY